jgi:hypothetical protein
MALNNSLIQGLLELFLQNTAMGSSGSFPGLPASVTAGSLYISFHTSDPGASGSQSTNEVAYTGYARVGLTRASGTWSVTGNTLSPAATITFPACTGGSATASFAGIGSSASGAGVLYWSGAVTPNISISSGVTPELTTGSTATLT